MEDILGIIQKVQKWAEANSGRARFVSGDTNVTYEDIIKVCEAATPFIEEDSFSDIEDEENDYDVDL